MRSMTRNARAWRAGMVTTGASVNPSESAALYRVSPAGAPAHAGLGPIPTSGCHVPDPVSARRPVAESPDTTKEEHGKTDQLLLKAKKQYQAAVRGEARLRQDMEDDRRLQCGPRPCTYVSVLLFFVDWMMVRFRSEQRLA